MTEARTSSDPRSAPRWLTWAALWTVYLIWGSTYLAIRVMVETVPPLFGAGLRFASAGLILLGSLVAVRGRTRVRLRPREIGASALVGGFLLVGGNGLLTVAERQVPSGLAALILSSIPLWVVLLRSISGEKVNRGTLAGVAVGFAGVAVLVLPADRPAQVTSYSLVLLIASPILWSIGSFYSNRLSLPKDPFLSTATQMLCAGPMLLVAGLVLGEGSNLKPRDLSMASIVALAYLVVAGSLLAFTAFVWLLQNAPISKVATYAYVNPVVAIFLGWAILSEEITVTVVVGAAIVLASVAFIVRKESDVGPRRSEAASEVAAGGEASASPRA